MFAILVVMSLVTTLATTPVLYLIRRKEIAAARTEGNGEQRTLHRHVERRRTIGSSG